MKCRRNHPKLRRLSFLGSSIKSMVQKDLEKDPDEYDEIPKPITFWHLTEKELLKIPQL